MPSALPVAEAVTLGLGAALLFAAGLMIGRTQANDRATVLLRLVEGTLRLAIKEIERLKHKCGEAT